MEHKIRTAENPWGPDAGIPLCFSSGGIWDTDRNYDLKRRNLKQYLLLYTLEGEGRLWYDGQEHRLLPGTAFCIDCMREQAYRPAEDRWKFAYAHFFVHEMRGYMEELYRRHGAVFYIPDTARLEHRFQRLLSLFSPGSTPSAPHRAFGILAEMVGMLYAAAEQERTGQTGELTTRVLRVMEERYGDKLTLDDFAREAQYSKYYLAHQFRQEMGLSVHEYLTLLRLSKAKLLLQSTNLPVADIASRTGFSDTSHFIQTFAKYEQLTPFQYRKQWM